MTDSTLKMAATKFGVLRQVFGYETFREGQEEIVDALIAGRHVLAVMPTGAGKSLCFQVPALVRQGLTIVVSPLVALMQDQVAALKLAGVAAETINSAASREDNVEIWRHVASGEIRILYMAPERLMTERMIAALLRLDIALIAVDEVHCLSQWGASFRPEYDALQNLRQVFPNVPIEHSALATLLPGFTLLSWPSFFLGLLESFGWGWYVSLVFGPLYNFFAARS